MTITYRLPQQRRLVTELPGPRSQALDARRKKAVPAGTQSSTPVYAAEADGGVIVDVDGNSLIDLASGVAVTGVGASNPDVVAAMAEQAQRFTHTAFLVTPFEGYFRVAERLNELTPGEHEKRSMLFNSGAEAVENAVKVARAATKRSAVVAFDHAFHGRTNLAAALTAKPNPYKRGFGPLASEVYRVQASYPFRDGLGVTGEQAARESIRRIEMQVAPDEVAAVIIEPIQGEGGFIVPAPGFLAALAEWASAKGVVFIADEIQTGFARTGDWFASDHEGVVPDLITTAKGIAGGMPLSAVTGRADLFDAVPPGGLGGTYSGNPVACAAALAGLDFMERADLRARARRIEKLGKARLEKLAAETGGVVGQVRGRGAMIGIELVDPETQEPATDLTKTVAAEVNRLGVVVLTCGTSGNVIRLLPPLVIPDELLLDGIDVISDVLKAQLNG
ncbi:MAG TPA: 4-aminobutyrate--2-oxoglutarate transaminase [Propionibacteriaceae bacterium]|nr:4-aminobutyrate--2-oxoglutarate transaminase [Propionibacteriaceae bacterium]